MYRSALTLAAAILAVVLSAPIPPPAAFRAARRTPEGGSRLDRSSRLSMLHLGPSPAPDGSELQQSPAPEEHGLLPSPGPESISGITSPGPNAAPRITAAKGGMGHDKGPAGGDARPPQDPEQAAELAKARADAAEKTAGPADADPERAPQLDAPDARDAPGTPDGPGAPDASDAPDVEEPDPDLQFTATQAEQGCWACAADGTSCAWRCNAPCPPFDIRCPFFF